MPALRAAVLSVLAVQLRAQGDDGPPPVGQPCTGCHCGNTDLSPYRGREFRTPADADGYVFLFQMCDPLSDAQLPEGCTTHGDPFIRPFPQPAVVKYKANDPLDCTLVGSFGGCDDTSGPCGMMTYQPHSNGLAVTWQYKFGCTNTFRIFLGQGHETQPLQAPHSDPNLCYWTTYWASLDAFGHVPVPGVTDEGCAAAYTAAYISTLNGACAPYSQMAPYSEMACSTACQAQLDDSATKCRGLTYTETDPITGLRAERSFLQKSQQALQIRGPVDCAYMYEGIGGREHWDRSHHCARECTLERILASTEGCLSVDPISGQSAPLAAFQSCEGACRGKFESLVSRCGRCSDFQSSTDARDFMADAGRKFATCTMGTPAWVPGGLRCGAMADVLESACPGGTMLLPMRSRVCSSAVQSAGITCPRQTTNDQKVLGLYLDSGGDLLQLLAAATVETVTPIYCSDTSGRGIAFPDGYDGDTGRRLLVEDTDTHWPASRQATCAVPVVPAHAALGSCDAAGLVYGETCEMTCDTGYCVVGSQPVCGFRLYTTMSCELQSVQTCTFPPNGGCDPHTTCTDSTNIFGVMLVQCSACPSGYYGSGRSGCYDINQCTVILNGGCDRRTTCTNLDGGYDCSPCSEVEINGVRLVGDSKSRHGCHLPGSPQQSEEPVSAAVGFAVVMLSMYACYMTRACRKSTVDVSHDGYGSTSTKTSIYDTHDPESARSSGSGKGAGLTGLVTDGVCFTLAGCRKQPAAVDAAV